MKRCTNCDAEAVERAEVDCVSSSCHDTRGARCRACGALWTHLSIDATDYADLWAEEGS